MSSGSNLSIGILLKAIDQASGPIARLNVNIAGVRAPVVKLNSELSRLGDLSGVKALSSGIAGIAREVTGLTLKVTGLAAAGGWLLKNQFVDTAAEFEAMRVQMDGVMGSAAQGESALNWITQFAKDTPLELKNTADAFMLLKNMGMDPMDGTLQALTDQMARMGKGSEHLMGVSMSLGQAWQLNKLQGDNVRELTQRGIPVYEMLSKATGKSVAKLQKMAEQGHLTRKSISILVKEIGKTNTGASKDASKTWLGITSTLSDNWNLAKRAIMDAGPFDWLKTRLVGLNTWLERLQTPEGMAELAKWGQRMEAGLNRAEQGVIRVGEWLSWAADKVGGFENLALVAFGGIAAIMAGPLLLAITSVAGGFASLVLALGANPFGAVLLAAGAAAVALSDVWDPVEGSWAARWDAITARIQEKIDGIMALVDDADEFWTKLDRGVFGMFSNDVLQETSQTLAAIDKRRTARDERAMTRQAGDISTAMAAVFPEKSHPAQQAQPASIWDIAAAQAQKSPAVPSQSFASQIVIPKAPKLPEMPAAVIASRITAPQAPAMPSQSIASQIVIASQIAAPQAPKLPAVPSLGIASQIVAPQAPALPTLRGQAATFADSLPTLAAPVKTLGQSAAPRDKVEVGGSVRIQIDATGQARVVEARSSNPNVPLSVDTGLALAGI